MNIPFLWFPYTAVKYYGLLLVKLGKLVKSTNIHGEEVWIDPEDNED